MFIRPDIKVESTGAICNKSVVFFVLQVDFYRFSIAWSRVIPSGKLAAGVNEAGVTYYNNIINGLIAKGVEPVATIYHWDLPQALHDDDGGWLNEKIIPHYNDFATLCFQRFGDRVRIYTLELRSRSRYSLGELITLPALFFFVAKFTCIFIPFA
jgi:Glycosyl hydrolase family 1